MGEFDRPSETQGYPRLQPRQSSMGKFFALEGVEVHHKLVRLCFYIQLPKLIVALLEGCSAVTNISKLNLTEY